jgi:hypothetical protein
MYGKNKPGLRERGLRVTR